MNWDYWIVLGLFAQGLFFMRFLVQWIASERAQETVVPMAFWYFSLAGSTLLLAYAVHRLDPVFILGQSMGAFIYVRNIVLTRRKTARAMNLPGGVKE